MGRTRRQTNIWTALAQFLPKVAALVFVSSLVWAAVPLHAHEVTPAIGDLTTRDGVVEIKLRLNVEAFVAGIDLDGLRDTNETEQAADYDMLRALPPDDLDAMVRAFAADWLEEIEIGTGRSVIRPEMLDVTIGPVGDVALPRVTLVTLQAALPAATRAITVHWPARSGGLVLRQQEVKDPYTGYLQGGETSPLIPLKGGAALSGFDVFRDYIPVGFEHILPRGLDHILFVLGLFFLSARLRPLLWQISAFTLAHTLTLALSVTGVVQVPAEIVEPLIAASIVYVAIENILTNRLHAWRTLIVFGFGLMHGLGFASVLTEFGLPQTQLLAALLGFNVGVELGQIAVVGAAYFLVGFWFGRHPKYRGRVAMPASFTIALIGAWWFIQRVFGL